MPEPDDRGDDSQGRAMKAHFVESQDERAHRLSDTVRRAIAGRAFAGAEAARVEMPAAAPELASRIAANLEAAAPGTARPVIEGVAAEIARTGSGLAASLLRRDTEVADLSARDLSYMEAVIRVWDRPAWFVRGDAPVPPQAVSSDAEAFWVALIAHATAMLRDTCGRVGCILKQEDGARTPIGTAWMIGDHTIVTNAHVALHLAHRRLNLPPADPRDRWRLRHGIAGLFDPAFENRAGAGAPISISDVLYVEASQDPDIAIFRLDREAAAPAPLALALADAGPAIDTNLFVVGHPIADANDDPNVKIVFGRLDGTKRFSPGRLTARLSPSVVSHDCSTTNGSSGSPVVDFATMQAIGLHYFGKPGERNEAVLFAALAEHPAVVRSLAGDWLV